MTHRRNIWRVPPSYPNTVPWFRPGFEVPDYQNACGADGSDGGQGKRRGDGARGYQQQFTRSLAVHHRGQLAYFDASWRAAIETLLHAVTSPACFFHVDRVLRAV